MVKEQELSFRLMGVFDLEKVNCVRDVTGTMVGECQRLEEREEMD